MKVNKRNLRRILKVVEASARKRKYENKHFCYGVWFQLKKPHKTIADVIKHPCGTAGCIGGWGDALILYDRNRKQPLVTYDDLPATSLGGIMNRVFGYRRMKAARAKWFGMSKNEQAYIFYGQWHDLGTRASDEDVIAKLKNIIKTGKVINPEFDEQYHPTTPWVQGLQS